MSAKPNRIERDGKRSSNRPKAKRVFATMADAGARIYLRARDLPKLIALWPRELTDESLEGRLHVVGRLRRALRAERRRALSSHWSYDLNRHLALLSAYKAEIAGLRACRSKILGQPSVPSLILVGTGDSATRHAGSLRSAAELPRSDKPKT